MKEISYEYVDRFRNKKNELVIHSLTQPTWRARLGTRLIEHFGSMASIPDGEDSSGRAKMRLQTPEELVQRCCKIADLAVTEFEKRGWIDELPDPTVETEESETERS